MTLLSSKSSGNPDDVGKRAGSVPREPRDLRRLYDDFFRTCNIIRQCFNNDCNFYRPIGTEW